MKEKIENFIYFLVVWFCFSIIALWFIVGIFKVLNYLK